MIGNKPYRVRITADGVTLWVASGVDNLNFSEHEKDAEVFTDNASNFSRHILPELEAAPFVGGIVTDPEEYEGMGFSDRGLEKLEFIF